MSEEVVYLLGEGGGRVRPHKLPLPEGIAQRLAKGQIRRVNEDGSSWAPEPEAAHAPEQGVSAPGRPAVNEPKARWVEWAVAQGDDPEAAEAMTKADLIDKHGR